MKMSEDGLNKIVGLLNLVLSKDPILNVHSISNSQYNPMYLKIFLDEAEKNNDAIGYDDFCEELWIELKKDASDYPEAENFMRTWTAWVELYRYLKENNKLANRTP